MATDRPGLERPPEPVVDQGLHADLLPVLVALRAMEHGGGHQVVALGEHVGLHHHLLAHGPLDREAPAIDVRGHPFDHHPPGRGRDLGLDRRGRRRLRCRRGRVGRSLRRRPRHHRTPVASVR